MNKRFLNPSRVSPPVGGYSLGLEVERASRLLFISGQIPETENGDVPTGFEAQCRQVWANIAAVLDEAGMNFGNLVKVTTFLADRELANENGRIRREILGDKRPALTVMVAQTLEAPWLLEIEAIAAA